jgi:multicomponent Na+:H+ antiporter subunit F
METEIIETAAVISFGILAIAMALSFIRLAIGPSLPDRIVALDLIASLTIGMVVALVFYTQKPVFIDIAVFIALIVFIGTVAISKYLKLTFYGK